jgi:hypothetical protein
VDENEFHMVLATLKESDISKAAALSKGQVVTVQCEQVTRWMGNPVAKDSVLVTAQQ